MRVRSLMDEFQTTATIAATSGAAGGGKVATSIGLAKAATIMGGAIGIIVMIVQLMTEPASRREQVVAGLSTFAFSLFGGSMAIMHFGLLAWLAPGDSQLVGLFAIGGVFIVCGAPGWLVVRAFFKWMEQVKDESLPDIVKDAKDKIL